MVTFSICIINFIALISQGYELVTIALPVSLTLFAMLGGSVALLIALNNERIESKKHEMESISSISEK